MNSIFENKNQLIGNLQEYLNEIQSARPKYGKFSKWVLVLGLVSLIAELTLLKNEGILFSPLMVMTLLLFGNIAMALFYQLIRRKDMLKEFSSRIIAPLLNSFFPGLKYVYEGEPVDEMALNLSDIFPQGRAVVVETKHHMVWPRGAKGYWANVIIDQGVKRKDYQVKGFFMAIPIDTKMLTPLTLPIDQEMNADVFQAWVKDKQTETNEGIRNAILEKIVQYKFSKGYSLHFSLKDSAACFFIKAHSILGQRVDLVMTKEFNGKLFFDTLIQELEWVDHLKSIGDNKYI